MNDNPNNGMQQPPLNGPGPHGWQNPHAPHLQQWEPKPPKKSKKGTVAAAVAGVLATIFVVSLVQGGEGENTAPPVTPAAAVTPVPSTPAEKPSKDAPAPVEEPEVTITSTQDLEDALDAAGLECDTAWINGADAGFDTSEFGVDLEACGQLQGDPMIVAWMGDSYIPVETLISALEEQGTFAGQYAVSDDEWLVVLPTKKEAKQAQSELGGSRTQL